MKRVRSLLGSLISGIARIHGRVLDGLVYMLETGVLLVRSFLKGCAILFGMGGCLAVFLLIGPVGSWLIRHPLALIILLLILIFPIIGAISITFLKNFKAVSTRYLQNLAAWLKDPQQHRYRSYQTFKQAYRRAQEEAAHREQARRARQQQEWAERFQQWQQWQQGGHWQQGGYQQGGRQYTANPFEDFKKKYEDSCRILEVPATADQYKIKLAYRRKAKAWHPDLNKAPGAKEQFQKISDAYEFLNEDNIKRYQSMA